MPKLAACLNINERAGGFRREASFFCCFDLCGKLSIFYKMLFTQSVGFFILKWNDSRTSGGLL